MPENQEAKKTLPPQVQDKQPGIESEMNPLPEFETSEYKAAGKLLGKAALITGETAESGVR